MATRVSGKPRRKNELYETPAWVISEGLCRHINVIGRTIAEPACGNGKMAEALSAAGAQVICSDIKLHRKFSGQAFPFIRHDFLGAGIIDAGLPFNIVTNPPYGPNGKTACQFIERGLAYLRSHQRIRLGGDIFMALLLPVDFDSAGTRAHLFELCPEFVSTIKLRRRIVWFKPRAGSANPSANHAWFIWSSGGRRSSDGTPGEHPIVLYAPRSDG